MKNRLLGVMCIVLSLAVVASAFAGGASQGTAASSKPIELSFAHHWGAAHPANGLLQGFADRIGELTGGRVRVTTYPGESLLTGANVYDGLLNGVTDIGLSDPGWALTNFPLLSASYVVGTQYNNSTVSTYAISEFFTTSDYPENREVKMLFAYGMTPYAIISKNPLKTMEDLKGVQIRGSGSVLPAVTALGGTPVGITIAETYDALLRGVADAAIAPIEALEGWNFGEVCKYVTIAPVLGAGHHYIAMNMKVWNSLPSDIQKLVEQASRESMEKFAPVFNKFDESAMEYGKKLGVSFYTVPQQELNRWIAALQPLEAQWINTTAAKGFPAQEALNKIRSLADKYNALYGK